MESAQSKFQDLLRELFQFDNSDLDFGIYRIMNYKRQVIERWIAEDLPQAISKGETREQRVDLPETFNYLLGLDVQTRKVYHDNGRCYLVYRGIPGAQSLDPIFKERMFAGMEA